MDNASGALKSLGVLAASWLTVLASHEAGHALAGKLFYNNPINIHLAPNPNFNVTDPVLYKIGPFSFHGIPLFGAIPGVSITGPATKKQAIIDSLKMIAIDSAGPLLGAVAGLLFNTSLNTLGIATQIPLCVSMLNLANLIPINTEGFISDGYSILQNIKHIKYLLTAHKTVYDIK
ncbi:hypothetical protein Noda2021_12390 [Candidatus Dependentiae bacterium Noda2021]|nr:hypothetical protein Noda2021_12390 [Candidatus Dependentiae bacterium Noda2021]